MAYRTENQKRAIAALTTFGVNVLILLILIFVAAWKSPGSGPGEYPGIEVNLGYDDYGTGDVDPMTPIGEENANDIDNPPANEEKQEEQTQAEPQQEESIVKPIESGTLTDPNSDVEIKEEPKKEEKPPVKTTEKKPENPTTEKVVEKPVEKKVEEKPKVADANAVYKPKSTSTTSGTGDGTKGTPGNQGDDANKEGNKGVPDGTVGAAVYKGKPGGGDGAALQIDGWNWDNIPNVVGPDTELPGRIVYLIEVDENGELLSYRKESGTVSAAFERECVAALQKLTFTKEANAKVPPVSKGRITFVVRAK
jgi:periplasmic protein TonB